MVFSDALEVNDSVIAVFGYKALRLIARELVKAIQNSITIDWTGPSGKTPGQYPCDRQADSAEIRVSSG